MSSGPPTPVPARSFRRRGLGRGLDALMTPLDSLPDEALVHLDPAGIESNPEQPRRDFDEAELELLAESIRAHGLLQPVVVQREASGYRLLAGERRLRAARRAGVDTIPALVRPAAESGREALELALVENLLRTDLNPIEEAGAYARLADGFGLSHEAIAVRLGRSRSAVSNSIRLLGLPPPVQLAVVEGRLSAGHARTLLGLSDPAQQAALAAQAEAQAMTVRQLERAVQARAGQRAAARGSAGSAPAALPGPGSPAAGPRVAAAAHTPDDRALERGLERALGLPVELRRGRSGGTVLIGFADDSDLHALYERLGGPQL